MCNDRFGKIQIRSHRPARARAFSLSELLIVVAIIAIVLAIAVPSFNTVAHDIAHKQARSDIFAALTAARSRALRERKMVALHIFKDSGPVYAGTSTSTRWGGVAHIPTNKMVMRLETARWTDGATDPVEFLYNNDHDPIILPDSIGIAQPGTAIGAPVTVEGSQSVKSYEDFYLVFADDGKLATVQVDYLCEPVGAAANGTSSPGNSATGLCIYDPMKFESLTTPATQYDYVNRDDKRIIISAYTGLPMSMEVNQ